MVGWSICYFIIRLLKFPTLSTWSKYLIFNLSHIMLSPQVLPTLQP